MAGSQSLGLILKAGYLSTPHSASVYPAGTPLRGQTIYQSSGNQGKLTNSIVDIAGTYTMQPNRNERIVVEAGINAFGLPRMFDENAPSAEQRVPDWHTSVDYTKNKDLSKNWDLRYGGNVFAEKNSELLATSPESNTSIVHKNSAPPQDSTSNTPDINHISSYKSNVCMGVGAKAELVNTKSNTALNFGCKVAYNNYKDSATIQDGSGKVDVISANKNGISVTPTIGIEQTIFKAEGSNRFSNLDDGGLKVFAEAGYNFDGKGDPKDNIDLTVGVRWDIPNFKKMVAHKDSWKR